MLMKKEDPYYKSPIELQREREQDKAVKQLKQQRGRGARGGGKSVSKSPPSTPTRSETSRDTN